MRFALFIATSGALSVCLSAQTKLATPAAVQRIEPGLEAAVAWKWWVVPSDDKDWGLPLPEPEPPAGVPAPDAAASNPAESRPGEYEVKRGDALILIGKKFGMTAHQIKAFNGLTSDTIRIGQVLKIPTLDELKALAPEPEKKAPEKAEKSAPAPAPKPEPVFESLDQENVLQQVFLDREQFPSGPIDGNPGAVFAKMLQLYQDSRADVKDIDAFKRKAREAVGEAYTRYTLKPEDHRFIAPPDDKENTGGRKSRKPATKGSAEPPPTYEDLVAASTLVYRTPWEFVAERFHCDESFLRKLNPRVKGTPATGCEFHVPNVVPFEIEKAFDVPLQPPADTQKPVTAAVVDLSRLEISQSGTLVAAMPLSLARPDLRGRGSWTILDAIPKPRLVTLQELKEQPKTTPTSAPVAGASPKPKASVPPPKAALASEQYLAAGPNNPVGIVWINLAKAKSTEPLPYGLHGTSIPGRMKTLEGIGGLRLANWDIIRAVRLLPPGTPIQWK